MRFTIEQAADGSWAIVYSDGRSIGGFPTAGAAASSEQAITASLTVAAPVETSDPVAITAALATDLFPVVDRPPDDWFNDPGFTASTTAPDPDCSDIRGCPLTITDDGEVFGHVALWGTCHSGNTESCTPPPRSSPGYPRYRTGEVLTASGARVPTGVLTVGTGHAPLNMDAAAAAAFYDNTGTAVADVTVGDDSYGPWVHGTIRPGATVAQVEALRRSPISGDWRPYGNRHEMVAALAVNTPGFQVPRFGLVASVAPRALVDAEGHVQALVAAGAQSLARIQASPWSGELDELRRRVDDLTNMLTPIVAARIQSELETALRN